jgi:hypothetical protein
VEVNAVLDTLPVLSFGYGRISGIKRSAEMNIDPRQLGKDASKLVLDYWKGKSTDFFKYQNYEIKFNKDHFNRLKLKLSH